MRTIRSFLALKLDLSVVDRLSDAQKRLRGPCREAGMTVRWIPPPNIHVTMRFLGNITEPMAYAVKDMLEPIVTKVDSFELEAVGLGAFPDVSRPRVIWAGFGKGVDVLTDLHSSIYNRLLKAGFNLDDKPFKAHLTLGRVKDGTPDTFEHCLKDIESPSFGVSTVNHLHCYESALSSNGAEYSSVWVLPFRKIHRRSPNNVASPPEPESASAPDNNHNGE